MARLLFSAIVCCLASGASAGIFSDCPSSLNTGAVGSCMFSSCSPSRGPTHCTFGSCYCNAGYCRYPASTLHVQSRYCVARVPGATCHLTRFCWSGGLSESFCESGLCMCKWGYAPQKTMVEGKATYECVAATAELSAAVARNATGEEIESLLEHQRHSDEMVAWNVTIASMWACGLLVATLAAGGVAFAVRRGRKKVSVHNFGEMLG